MDGRPTSLGLASGAIAGLVGITPACGYVDTMGALVIGLAAGVASQLAIKLKYRLGYDDSLDVVALHGVAGLLGMLMIGFFATTAVNSAGADGLFYGGGWTQLGRQLVASGAALGWAFGVSLLLGWLIKVTIGFRADREEEMSGLDEIEHAETAYEFSTIGGTSRGGETALTQQREEKHR